MEKLLKLKYFKDTKGLCSDDFNKKDKIVYINPLAISEVTDVQSFHHPFTNDFVCDFFTITLINNSIYYCRSNSFKTVMQRFYEEV